jgi:hypothetical protein
MPHHIIYLLIFFLVCLSCKSNETDNQRKPQSAAFTHAQDSFFTQTTGKFDKTYKSERKVVGKRSEKEVLSFIYKDDNVKVLRYAYNRRLRENPGLVGWAVFTFHIVSSGQVVDCTITDSQLNDTLLQNEITAEIMKWQFKPLEDVDTTFVVFPFWFGS